MIRDNIVEIVTDRDNMRIITGDVVWEEYAKLSYKEVADKVVGVKGNGRNFKWSKEQNKEASEKLGMPPILYTKLLNHKLWELWVKPYNKQIMQQCYQGRYYKLSKGKLKSFYENKDTILQMYEDGQANLVPFVIAGFTRSSSLQGLRKDLGKGLWKSLCSNSLSRNKLIAHSSYSVSDIAHANQLPSSYLGEKRRYGFTIDMDLFRVANSKGYWSKSDAYRRGGFIAELGLLYTDTRRMAEQLSQPFNPKWSHKRMQEQHDKYTQMINARKYSKDEWESVQGKPDKIEYKGYTAHLIKSPYELHQEGDSMHHCVASYRDMVEKGEYLVYSIRDEQGERVSTLGVKEQPVPAANIGVGGLLDITMEKKWKVDQHYGKCNSKVDNTDQKALAAKIEELLNDKSSTIHNDTV